jgi:hypothetical protein
MWYLPRGQEWYADRIPRNATGEGWEKLGESCFSFRVLGLQVTKQSCCKFM